MARDDRSADATSEERLPIGFAGGQLSADPGQARNRLASQWRRLTSCVAAYMEPEAKEFSNYGQTRNAVVA